MSCLRPVLRAAEEWCGWHLLSITGLDTFVDATTSQRSIQCPLPALVYLIHLLGTSHLSAVTARAWRMSGLLL